MGIPADSRAEVREAVGGSTLQAVVSLPWRIDQDNDKGLCVVDARGEIVYVEDWGGIPDEMSSGMREQIIEQARANARFMVAASDWLRTVADQHAERKAEAPEVRPEVAALIERQRDAQRHNGECRCGAGFARYCCAHCWPQ